MAKATAKCKAKTKGGAPCKARPGPDGYCYRHSPARAAEAAEASRRGGLASPRKVLNLDGSTAFETAADVKELIGKVMLEVANSPATAKMLYTKARTVGYLATVLLKAFELSDHERRMQIIEGQLGIKPGGPK